ncbi:hypothetical protein [Psychrobacter sp. 72-O-c]|uniref:hypothetical protein n=1 Tax=Psychrobacter sp. 72-O-c TaxID=2774125 RepID=UPI00191A0E34|nr:hypothetical protein [Psychrobacter sp. 72-O-c]
MQNRLLPLSLLVGAALVMPGLAIAAPANSTVMPADMRVAPVDNTLQAEIEGPDGELLATQPGEVEVNEQEALNGDVVAVQPLNMQHSNANYQPLIMGEAYNSSDVTPADQRSTAAPITLQEKKKGPRGELLATQPGEVEVSESRRFIVR